MDEDVSIFRKWKFLLIYQTSVKGNIPMELLALPVFHLSVKMDLQTTVDPKVWSRSCCSNHRQVHVGDGPYFQFTNPCAHNKEYTRNANNYTKSQQKIIELTENNIGNQINQLINRLSPLINREMPKEVPINTRKQKTYQRDLNYNSIGWHR